MASHVYKLGVPKSKEVETMANFFENTPKYMKWTPKMVIKATFWTLAVPAAFYAIMRPVYVRIFCTAKIDSSMRQLPRKWQTSISTLFRAFL